MILCLVSLTDLYTRLVGLSASAELLVYMRDAKHSAVYAAATWLGGWLGGCLSVIRRYCIKTAKPVLKRCRPSASHIILVSSELCTDTYPRGTPSAAVQVHGCGKGWRFSTEIAVYVGNGAR